MMKSISAAYRRFFSLEEIEKSVRLQLTFLVILFICVIDFVDTGRTPYPKTTNVCWDYWINCADHFQINGFPNSYSYTTWSAFVMGLMLITFWAFIKRRWNIAHLFLFIIIIWKFMQSFVLSNFHMSNFQLIHLIPAFTFLITRNKASSLRYALALTYLFAVQFIINDSWIQGSIFSSMKLGLPLLPNFMIPVATNLVVVGEMLLSIGLIFPNRKIQRFSFWSWTALHLYSAIIIGYYYPVRYLGLLWVVFGLPELDPFYQWIPKAAFGKRTILIVTIIAVINFAPIITHEDQEFTFEGLEGNDYGYNLVNANYQCIHEITQVDSAGQKMGSWKAVSRTGTSYCYPQDVFQLVKNQCKGLQKGQKILWTFIESRNGSPFYELIHESDACSLDYKAFGRNKWIKIPTDSPVVGYPEKNMIGELTDLGDPKVLQAPTEPREISFLEKNYLWIRKVYLTLWYSCLAYMICFLFQLRFPFLMRMRFKK